MRSGASDGRAVEPPLESVLLKRTHQRSGVAVADLATATGLSISTIRNALSGTRHRDGKEHVAVPPDRTLVKLATVLRVEPEALRAVGRNRAAKLVEDALRSNDAPSLPADIDAQSIALGRSTLARKILAAFSTEELITEVDRRDREESERMDQEALDDIADTIRAEQWPL